MSEKPGLLLVGDFGSPTGFARVNENLARRLKDRWDIKVIGINYHGDPRPVQQEFHIYPAMLGGDPFGINRIASIAAATNPNVILLANDSWNVGFYLGALENDGLRFPTVAYIPVDAPNQSKAASCNGLASLITTTEFGMKAMRDSGYTGRGCIIPYGVDTTRYFPGSKRQARINRHFPEALLDAYIVGRADRNAARKRYDLSTEYWAEWFVDAGRPEDAYLFYHCAPKDSGWDLLQLAEYYGIGNRLIVTARDLNPGIMVPEKDVPDIFRTWDVHLSTTLGEGWGLIGHESAACGVAQLVPQYAAYGEWLKGAAAFVTCTGRSAMTEGVNTIGGIADKNSMIEWIDKFHKNANYEREYYGNMAHARATESRFEWANVAELLHNELEAVKR